MVGSDPQHNHLTPLCQCTWGKTTSELQMFPDESRARAQQFRVLYELYVG